MKNQLLVIFALTMLLSACTAVERSDPLIGDWAGTLNLGGVTLRLIFHISEINNDYVATIESVDQGAQMIPAEIEVAGDSVRFVVDALGVEYAATMSGNEMVGEFTQFGGSMPGFTITRSE